MRLFARLPAALAVLALLTVGSGLAAQEKAVSSLEKTMGSERFRAPCKIRERGLESVPRQRGLRQHAFQRHAHARRRREPEQHLSEALLRSRDDGQIA